MYAAQLFRQPIDGGLIEYHVGNWIEYKHYPPEKIENFIHRPAGWTYRSLTELEVFAILI